MSLTVKEIFMNIAPAHYADAALLANTIGQEMLTRLDWVALKPQVVLDVGCGTGFFTRALQERYPEAQVLAVDNAYPMLQAAAQQADAATYLCADAYALPLGDQSVDLIFANLLLPWCDDLEKLMREWRRVLRKDGLLVFTSFGPDTLRVWREELGNLMLPNFIDMHLVGDVLTKSRFADPVLDVDYFTLTYRDSADLFRELHHGGILLTDEFILQNPEAGLTEDGIYPAAFEVVYGHAFGPDVMVDQVADAMGVVSIPLSRLRRR
jgi:malonyl-CoA O-methyltransferase